MYRLNALFAKYSKSVPLVASIPAIIAGNDWYEYIRHNNTTKSHTNSSFKPSLTLRSVRLEDTTLADHMSQVYERSVPSVVIITNRSGTGTGFIVDKESGLIVTNSHVVKDWEFVSVTLYQPIKQSLLFNAHHSDDPVKEIRGRVLYCHPDVDLAVISVYSTPGALSALKLSERTDLKAGEPLISIGNPRSLVFSVSLGLLNSTDRYDRSDLRGMISRPHMEHSAHTILGYSGGPVLDGTGDVVGVTSMGIETPELRIDIAIRSTDAIEIVNKAKIFETKSLRKRFSMSGKKLLGVVLERKTAAAVQGVPTGRQEFVVTDLAINAPKDDKGLRICDSITEINGKPFETFTQLEEEMQSVAKDKPLKLKITRKGVSDVIDVTPLSGDDHNCSLY